MTVTIGTMPAAADSVAEDIALRLGDLAINLASVTGDVDDITAEVGKQSVTGQSMNQRADQIMGRAQTILGRAQTVLDTSVDAEETATSSDKSMQEMVLAVTSLIETVAHVGEQFSQLQETLARVARVSDEIRLISRQTNLLSVNAAIEAARAGEHGRGFLVLAREIKNLSDTTREATEDITNTVDAMDEELATLKDQTALATGRAGDVQQQINVVGTLVNQIPQVMGSIITAQRDIFEATTSITGDIGLMQTGLGELATGIATSDISLVSARKKMLDLTDIAETLVAMTARLGVETADTPFIAVVQDVADRISARFKRGIANGEISKAELFSRDYAPIAGTDPPQVMAPFTRFTDYILPEFQEAMLEFSDTVVFCAAVNVDGYLPTHNLKFNHPQRAGDTAWNTANCRNRRIFNDRVGLAAGRSTRPFLLQAYRRDMGNGSFVMMKDVSAPIKVDGSHWGGIRLAYLA